MQRSASGNSWKAKLESSKKWNQTVVVGHTLVQRAKAVHILPLKSVVDLMMHFGSRNAYRATGRRCVNANKKKRTVQGSNRPHSVCYNTLQKKKMQNRFPVNGKDTRTMQRRIGALLQRVKHNHFDAWVSSFATINSENSSRPRPQESYL